MQSPLVSSGNVVINSSNKMFTKSDDSPIAGIVTETETDASVAEAPQVYEDDLRQLEKGVRQHIQTEQQMHHHIESL